MTEKLPQIVPVSPEITSQPTAMGWNFEAVKSYMTAITERYAGLAVTDENVDDMNKTLREVVHLRTGFNKFEKKGKDVLNGPLLDFKNQCNELLGVIEQVEKPLSAQLQRYEDDRVAELSDKIAKEIDLKAAANGLRGEYLSQFVQSQKWLNKTFKYSETTIEIDREIYRLVLIQKSDDERKAMLAERRSFISSAVDMANMQYGLSSKLSADTYVNLDATEYPFSKVKEMIDADAKGRKQIEDKAIKKAKEEVENKAAETAATETKYTAEPGSECLTTPEMLSVTVKFKHVEAKKLDDFYEMIDLVSGYDVLEVSEE